MDPVSGDQSGAGVWDTREAANHEREMWDAFVRSAPNGHVFQGWSWGEYKRHSGWVPVRIVLEKSGTVEAVAQVLFRSVAGVSLAYVPRGPVIAVDRPDAYRQLLAEIHRQARRRRAIFLKIEPNEPGGSAVERFLCEQGFRPSHHGMRPEQPWATLTVDLSAGLEAVMAGIKPRIRRYVRAAERQLTVRQGQDAQDVAVFQHLTEELATRRHMPPKPVGYYQDLLDELGPLQEATLLLAELDGQVIAGLIALAYGDEGASFHAGSSSKHRDLHANHLLQWKAMEWCAARGCARYDMWGVFELPTLDRSSAMAGVPLEDADIIPAMLGIFNFKQGFGGDTVRFVGAFDFLYNEPLFYLWTKAPAIQRALSHAVTAARDVRAASRRRLSRSA